MKSQLHMMAQNAILDACNALNYTAQLEYHCSGYRPDVMVFVGEKKYAFEIQVSPQSFKKTRERQVGGLPGAVIGFGAGIGASYCGERLGEKIFDWTH